MIKHKHSVPLFNVKHNYFKNSFFPSTVIEWNKWGSNIRNAESLALFEKRIMAFIRPFAKSTFQCHDLKGLKLITRLRLWLSHLRFHKFKHSLQDTLNPICNCGTVETTVYYLLHSPNFSKENFSNFKVLMLIQVKTAPTFQNCFSVVITHLMMKKMLLF